MHLANRCRNYLCLILAILSLCISAPAQSEIAPAQYHFAGGTTLAGDSNLVVLNKLLALPSTLQFQKLIAEKAATYLVTGPKLGTNSSGVSLLAPLLEDALKTESVGGFDGSDGNAPDFVVAFRLDAQRQQVWQTNLDKIFGGAGSFWRVPSRGWLLIGRGHKLASLRDAYLQQISLHGRPIPALNDVWLEVDIDGSHFPGWPQLLKTGRLKGWLSSKGGNLQMDARLTYSSAIAWKSELWQLPTNLVHNPLISFTAGQNMAAFLNLTPSFLQFDGNPLTNQFYAWALGQMPFQTYAAWPTPSSSNILQKLSNKALASFNSELKKYNRTELVWVPKYNKLVLSGLRVVAPAIGLSSDHNQPFLLMAFFPSSSRNEAAPAQLWEQVRGRTNLVYYDWELTGPRLQQWRLLGHVLFDRIGSRSNEIFDAAHNEDQWLDDLGNSLGNTVTEMTQISPNEFSIVRNAPIGVTAVELFAFCEWLSGKGL